MKYAEFLPRILPYCKGCPDELAIEHIVDAAREFCSGTLAWNYQAPTIKSTKSLANYTLQFPAGEELVRLLLCEVDGAEYKVPKGTTGRQLSRDAHGNICTLSSTRDFLLSPAPHADNLAIITEIAVKPALGSTGEDEWPQDLTEHVTDIVHGALATLLALPKMLWRDPAESVNRALKFQGRKGIVAMRVAKGFGHSRQGAKTTWF